MYMILNDLIYIIQKKYKIIIAYFIIFSYYYLWGRNIGLLAEDNYFIDMVFGGNFDLRNLSMDILYAVYFVLNYGVPIFLGITLFYKDLDDSNNLFLRVSVNKWLDSKVLSFLILSCFMFSYIYILAFLFKTVELTFYLFILKKTLYVTTVQMLIYNLLIFSKKSKIICGISSLCSFAYLLIPVNLYNVSIIYIIICFVVVFLILNILNYFIRFSDIRSWYGEWK